MLFSSCLLLFSRHVTSLSPHGLQPARPPCPSPSLRVCPSSCPLNRWCHPTTSSSVVPFSSCPDSFPASGSFPMSRLFASGGQSIGASASASVLPVNIQGSFPMGLISLISLLSKGLSRISPGRKGRLIRREIFLVVRWVYWERASGRKASEHCLRVGAGLGRGIWLGS